MKRMKTTSHSARLLAPLAGPICALLTVAFVTPISFVSTSHAEKPAPSSKARVVRSSETQERPSTEPKGPVRSPEEALAKGLEYLLGQQHSDGGWGQGGGWRQSTSK